MLFDVFALLSSTQPSVGLLATRVQAYLFPGKPQMTPREALAVLHRSVE